jgi:hypothetical protein
MNFSAAVDLLVMTTMLSKALLFFVAFALCYQSFGQEGRQPQPPVTPGGWQTLAPCQCRFGSKDYDPQKGYYFDRLTWDPFPHVSGHFACNYLCADKEGYLVRVGSILDESYVGWTKGGPDNAKKFICKYSIDQFIPITDELGRVVLYDTTPGRDFDPKTGVVPELRNWAGQYCQ